MHRFYFKWRRIHLNFDTPTFSLIRRCRIVEVRLYFETGRRSITRLESNSVDRSSSFVKHLFLYCTAPQNRVTWFWRFTNIHYYYYYYYYYLGLPYRVWCMVVVSRSGFFTRPEAIIIVWADVKICNSPIIVTDAHGNTFISSTELNHHLDDPGSPLFSTVKENAPSKYWLPWSTGHFYDEIAICLTMGGGG